MDWKQSATVCRVNAALKQSNTVPSVNENCLPRKRGFEVNRFQVFEKMLLFAA